ncbi:MAG TPA: hypothetical protein VNL94_08250 [Candidatus Binatia bacterium]|nr:hypothetical protein [Candidatus Binatia bacterium]
MILARWTSGSGPHAICSASATSVSTFASDANDDGSGSSCELPPERTLALVAGPGMEVIGKHREFEAGRPGAASVRDEVQRPALLARAGVAEAAVRGHAAIVAPADRRSRPAIDRPGLAALAVP